ncbi:MAG: sugar transferase [Anaerolineae bacterium]
MNSWDLVVIPRPQVSVLQPRFDLVKRIFDVTLCLLGLPVVIPVALICAIAIRLDSPGPIFFVQERVGKNGRLFRMYKFRTLVHNYHSNVERRLMKAFVSGEIDHFNCLGNEVKPIDNTKITRVGRILRKLSLDELPQLLNICRGNMSLIGPRPHVTWEVEAYRDWHYERLEVLPGITGLAQVRGRSALSFDQLIRYDVEYVNHRRLLLDIKILLWTVKSVITAEGAG